MTGLRVRGNGAEKLAADFYREGDMTSKRALRKMRAVAKSVMEQSIAQVPYETGELEDAHHIEENVGAGRRIEITVSVGGMVKGIDTDKYVEYIHHGSWENLGKGSAAKQAANPGVTVGKYFLVRAIEDHEDAMDDLVDELVEALL